MLRNAPNLRRAAPRPLRAGFAIVLAATTTLLGSGCVLFLGGAALGGAVVATDRRSVGIQIEDTAIEHRVNQTLDGHFPRASVRIDVTSYNQKVLLAGRVPREQDRTDAQALAAAQENVRQVYNELAIGSLAGLDSQGSDLVLAAKVRAALLDVPALATGVVKTTCTYGDIYLLGRVRPAEAELATRAASHINGVKRVVALFDLLTDDPLEQLQRGK